MNINGAALFNLTSEILVNEIIGHYLVKIHPGSFCRLDMDFSTNGQHHHTFYELCMVVSGSGEYFHGNERVLIREGDVFVADPEVKHEIKILKNHDNVYADNLYLVFFMISITNLDKVSHTSHDEYEYRMLEAFLHDHCIFKKSCGFLLSYLDFLQGYITGHLDNKYGIYHMVRNMALEGLFVLARNQETYHHTNISTNNQLKAALKFIETNLHMKIRVKDIASSIFNSERNIHYLFKKNMNKTVNDYINERKMSIAAIYLKMGYKVSDTGPLVGIDDMAQFSRLFKKYKGVSPKRYQITQAVL